MAKDYLHKGRSRSQNIFKCFWICSRCVKYKHLVTCKNTIEVYLYIIPNLMFQILNPLGMSGPFGKLPVWLQHVYCPQSPSLGGCTVAICDDTHTKIQGSEVHVASSWYSSSQVARGLPILTLWLANHRESELVVPLIALQSLELLIIHLFKMIGLWLWRKQRRYVSVNILLN